MYEIEHESPSTRSDRWCFTSYDCSLLPELTAPAVYMVYQGEVCPTTGRNHIQGYVRFSKRQRWEQVCEYFSQYSRKKVWCQASKGSEEQNRVYCTKATKDNKPMEVWLSPREYGEYDPEKGVQRRRTDLVEIKARIKTGATYKDLCESDTALAVYHPHGVEKLIATIGPKPPKERDVQVLVMWGDGDLGKSHRVWNSLSAEEDWTNIYKVRAGRGPFDMYDKQTTIFFEEFDWHKWCIHDMKEYLDKWPCQIDCRFANKYAWWTRVIITSNEDPATWYPIEFPANRAALFRRMPKIVHITSRDQEINSDSDYLYALHCM